MPSINSAAFFGAIILLSLLALPSNAPAQTVSVGANINMICGLGDPGLPASYTKCDPSFTKQNEPSIAVNTRNPSHLLAATNDYRGLAWQHVLSGVEGDAFLNVLKSNDGGRTWRGGLHPGCPENDSICDEIPLGGAASAIKGLSAAADPMVRCGPFGICFIGGIAFNRGSNATVKVFLSRWIDDSTPTNAKGDSTRYFGTAVLDQGTSSGITGQFTDRPALAIDTYRPTDPGSITVPASGNIPQQNYQFGRIYAAWDIFTGSGTSTKIKFSSSIDGGNTWSNPSVINGSALNQGITIAIDPQSGAVVVAWRQFANQSTNTPDAIEAIISTNQGKQWSKPIQFVLNGNFDQDTSATPQAARIFSVPTLAISVGSDGVSRVHLAWSDRTGPKGNDLFFGGGQFQDAKVMMATARLDNFTNVNNWKKVFIDTQRSPSDPANSFNSGSPQRGHQFYPAMTVSGGIGMIVYYDLRDDNTTGTLQCPTSNPKCSRTQDMVEVRVPTATLSPDCVFTKYMADVGANAGGCSGLRRHTVDVRVTQFDPINGPITSNRVSQFIFGSVSGTQTSTTPTQLRFNPPNLPLFRTDPITGVSSAPFIGDFIDVGALQFKPNPCTVTSSCVGAFPWITAVPADNNLPVFYGTWTSNHGVVPEKSSPPIETPQNPGACGIDSITGQPPGLSRNQDTYVARIAPTGLFLSARRTSWPLDASAPRGFPLTVQNTTTQLITVQLTANPLVAGAATVGFLPGSASSPTTPNTNQVSFTVAPISSVSRTLFATSSATTPPPITVTAISKSPTGYQSSLLINGDSSNQAIAFSDTTGSPSLDLTTGVVTAADQSNSLITNPGITFDVSSFDVSSFDVSSFDVSSFDVSSFDVSSFDVSSFDVSSLDVSTFDVSSFDVSSFDVSSFDVSSSSIRDLTSQVTNSGNQDTTASIKLLKSATAQCCSAGCSPSTCACSLKCQLIINRHFLTPALSAGGQCSATQRLQSAVVANIPSPTFTADTSSNASSDVQTVSVTNGDITNALQALAPGEMFSVTLRTIGPSSSTFCSLSSSSTPGCVDLPNMVKSIPAGLTNVTNASSGLNQTAVPLSIISLSLPPATYGVPYTNSVQAIGGAKNWTVVDAQDLPPAFDSNSGFLTLDSATGSFSGAPSARAPSGGQPGVTPFVFTVQTTEANGSACADNPKAAGCDVEKLSLFVNKASTTTNILLVPNPSVPNQTVTVTVTEMPQKFGTPTGTVNVTSNGVQICSITLSGGTGSCTTVFTKGTYTISASYGGDTNFLGSSNTAIQKVATK